MGCLGEDSFCIKKGSRTVHEMVVYLGAPINGSLYDLSAYNTAELFVYTKQGGTLFLTITGSITQNESKLTFIFAKSDTVSLTNLEGYYNIKLSASGDSTLDKFFVNGTIEFIT